VQPVVAQPVVAQVQEPPVVRHSRVEECLARAGQCQDPARSHPCPGNPRPDREALPENQEDQPDRGYPVKKAHHRILPESPGPAQPGNRQAWDRVLPKGLARLEHHPDQAATNFPVSYRWQRIS